MNRFLVLLFLLAISVTANCSDVSHSLLYLNMKREAINSLDTPETSEEQLKENEALIKKARELMATILRPTKIPGFKAPIALPGTFLPELGRDYSDGYFYYSEDESIFVSSTDFFKRNANFYPQSNGRGWPQITNAALMPFWQLRKSSGTGGGVWLALSTQDIGPFPPNTLHALIVKNKLIMVIWRPVELNDVPRCTHAWENSKVTPEQKRFQVYVRCYRKNRPTTSGNTIELQAKNLEKRAVQILGLIESGIK